MAITAHINLIRTEGGIDRRIAKELAEPTYTEYLETTEVLAAATKTEILTNMTTIQMIFIDTGGATVRVHQNGALTYWEVDSFFLAFDCSLTQLELYAADGATVHVFLGGE